MPTMSEIKEYVLLLDENYGQNRLLFFLSTQVTVKTLITFCLPNWAPLCESTSLNLPQRIEKSTVDHLLHLKAL